MPFFKQITIVFDDKRLACVRIHSPKAVGVFERLIDDPIQYAPRRILSMAFDHIFAIICEDIANDVEKNTILLLLNDLYAIKIALNVIIKGHRVIGITFDKET